MKLHLAHWAVVAPGFWGQSPLPAPHDEVPFALDFVPAAQRRRLSLTTKLALQAASLCLPQEKLKDIPLLFISRHGELANTVKVLHEIEHQEMPSPTQFIHSVHGTAAGSCSMLFGNQQKSITLACGENEISMGLFEVAAQLSDATKELLMVCFDAPPLGKYLDYVSQPTQPYAVALHWSHQPAGQALELAEGALEPCQWAAPQALSFVQWIQSPSPSSALLPHSPWRLIKA